MFAVLLSILMLQAILLLRSYHTEELAISRDQAIRDTRLNRVRRILLICLLLASSQVIAALLGANSFSYSFLLACLEFSKLGLMAEILLGAPIGITVVSCLVSLSYALSQPVENLKTLDLNCLILISPALLLSASSALSPVRLVDPLLMLFIALSAIIAVVLIRLSFRVRKLQ